MKKVFVAVLLIVFMINNTVIYADFDTENTSEKLLSRGDCLIFIMKAIGAKKYTYNINDNWVVCDFDENIVGSNLAQENLRKWYSESMFTSVSEMPDIAIMYAGIVNGEYKMGYDGEFVYYNYTRAVTLDEALAVMVRCLREDKADGMTLEKTFQYAQQIELIKNGDLFYDNPQKTLTLSEFKTIFKRFLDMPRGLYHQVGHYTFYDYDQSGDKTYYEALADRYTTEYVEKLLEYDGSCKWNPDDRFEYIETRTFQLIEENNIEIRNESFSDDAQGVLISAYSVIPNVYFDGKYCLALELKCAHNKYDDINLKRDIKVYQNGVELYSQTFENSDVGTFKILFELNNPYEKVEVRYLCGEVFKTYIDLGEKVKKEGTIR